MLETVMLIIAIVCIVIVILFFQNDSDEAPRLPEPETPSKGPPNANEIFYDYSKYQGDNEDPIEVKK